MHMPTRTGDACVGVRRCPLATRVRNDLSRRQPIVFGGSVLPRGAAAIVTTRAPQLWHVPATAERPLCITKVVGLSIETVLRSCMQKPSCPSIPDGRCPAALGGG